MPDNSTILTHSEYENLLNEVKAKVLGYASMIDTQLTEILTEIFLLDFDTKGIWFDTVFDEERQATFGSRIIWLGKVMAHHHEISQIFDEKRRKNLINALNEILAVRNLFAHTVTFRNISDDMIKNRTLLLMDFKGMDSNTITKNMEEIANLVNDETVMNETNELIRLAIKIRQRRIDEMCKSRKNEQDYLEELQKTMGN